MNPSTRSKLIRLAYEKPELRSKILPLIKEAKPSYSDYADKKKRKGEEPLPKDKWETKVLGKKPPEGRYERGDQFNLPPIEVNGGPNTRIPRRTRDAIKDVMDNPNDVEALKELVEEIKANLEEPKAVHGHEDGDKEEMKALQEENQKLYGEPLTKLQEQLDSLGAGKPKNEKPDDAAGKDSEKKSKKTKEKSKHSKPLASALKKYNLKDEDGDEVKAFLDRKPSQGRKLTNQEMFQRFLKNAKPETKERMKNMSPAEFMEIVGAITDDDEGPTREAASLRSQLIRLAHQKPELRKHLLPLIKKEGGSVNMKVSEGYPHIRYRIENEGLPTARCMVVFTYRVGKKAVTAQSLISDLNEFEKRCFSMTKSLDSLLKSRNLGSLDFKDNFVRVELATQYPLLGKYTAYFNIDNDSVEQMRAILEKGFGATDIRS